MNKVYCKKSKMIYLVMIMPFILYAQNHYKDITSMLLDIKPFAHEVHPGFVSANYNGDIISSIDWFDQDVVNKLPFDAVERYFKYFLTEGTFEWRGTQYDVQEQVSY